MPVFNGAVCYFMFHLHRRVEDLYIETTTYDKKHFLR